MAELVDRFVIEPISSVIGLFSTPGFFLAIAITLLLQHLVPADRTQKTWAPSMAQDFVWVFYERIMHAIFIASYVAWLGAIYESYFSYLTVERLADAPIWLRLVLGVLLLDFLYWVQHVLNHKVPGLWQFHAVHHSQKELNFFTDYRYHLVEYVARYTVLTIPFLVLQFDVPSIVGIAFFLSWYTRFYHGNIRTNLGPLKRVLVTPQSHRVHHACDPQYRDTNFGSVFSIWDHLFGTQVKNYDVYPATGIDDTQFPHEDTMRLPKLLYWPIVQMVYPLRAWRRRLLSSATAQVRR